MVFEQKESSAWVFCSKPQSVRVKALAEPFTSTVSRQSTSDLLANRKLRLFAIQSACELLKVSRPNYFYLAEFFVSFRVHATRTSATQREHARDNSVESFRIKNLSSINCHSSEWFNRWREKVAVIESFGAQKLDSKNFRNWSLTKIRTKVLTGLVGCLRQLAGGNQSKILFKTLNLKSYLQKCRSRCSY